MDGVVVPAHRGVLTAGPGTQGPLPGGLRRLERCVLALRLAMTACVEITQSDVIGQRLAALLRDTESEARRTNAMWSGARSRPIGPWVGARG